MGLHLSIQLMGGHIPKDDEVRPTHGSHVAKDNCNYNP